MPYLYVFLISMAPLIELRGAVPVGIGLGLDPAWVYVIAVIANMVPVPFIYFFARKILVWGSNKKLIGGFCRFCIRKGEKGKEKLTAKAETGVFLALMLFVGVPLPGTGAWTGTLAASLLNFDFKKSVLAVMLGVLLAGVIMWLVSTGAFAAFGIL